MTVAIWIIAACEIIRILQNTLQLKMMVQDTGARDNAYSEFIKSLKDTDKEYVKKMLQEFEEQEREVDII